MKLGKWNKLILTRVNPYEAWIDVDNKQISVPTRELPLGSKPGDEVEVFVFNRSKDKLAGTTTEPFAEVGEFAILEVKDVTAHGLFLDWGISKDLYLPQRELKREWKKGEEVVVYVTLDSMGTGVVGTTEIKSNLSRECENIKINDEVDLLVYGLSDLGYRVIVNQKFGGLIYQNEVFEKVPRVGDRKTGYVKKIRDDGQLDIALQPQGFIAASDEMTKRILRALEDSANGEIPLGDKSSPEIIKRKLNMSKKNFKKAIGVLYKEKLIEIKPEMIKLLHFED